mmetsp:Transcript_36885/g.56456  ORF Transcript_36885/g.56456 Transcript_36885/m.56456 type:complete len:103 (-) Transcript_36885:1368-1676(-)
MPVFTAKHNELKEHQGSVDEQAHIDMLGTIRLPHNLKLIQRNLPESAYDDPPQMIDIKKVPRKKNDPIRHSMSGLDEIKEENAENEAQERASERAMGGKRDS